MPMMTAAVNEKIARRDMITCPSLVAEKGAFLPSSEQTIWNRLRQRAATCRSSIAPLSFASLI
jgi:hypothetical protein